MILAPVFFFFSSCDSAAPSLLTIKQEIRSKFPEVHQISAETLANWQEQEDGRILLVDVREAPEYAISHLKDAANLQRPDRIRALYQNGDYSKLVVYCSVGYRSAQLARQLQKMGLPEVFNLEGSIFEWANQGRQVFDASGPVQRVHPYDSEWGKLLRPELRAPID